MNLHYYKPVVLCFFNVNTGTMIWNRILTFIIGVNVCAWAGGWVANGIDAENPALQAGGVFFMSMSPLLMAFILKKIDKEDWSKAGLKFRFSENKKWYLLSFFLPLIMIFFVIGLSFLSESVMLIDTFGSDLPKILGTSAGLFLAFFVGAIGEEFGWRGYFESTLYKVNKSIVGNHIIVGIVWFAWHLPLLVLTPGASTSFPELFMIMIGVLALAIIYGQLRIISGTVWTCVLLHGASNAFTIGFGSANVLEIEEGFNTIISLSSSSVAVVSFWVIVSISMLALFLKRSKEIVANEAAS